MKIRTPAVPKFRKSLRPKLIVNINGSCWRINLRVQKIEDGITTVLCLFDFDEVLSKGSFQGWGAAISNATKMKELVLDQGREFFPGNNVRFFLRGKYSDYGPGKFLN